MFDRMRTVVAAIVVASLVAFFVRPAQAHVMSIAVANYSFEGSGEQPSVADGGWTTTIAGWTVGGIGPVVVCNPTESQFAGAAGDGALPAPAEGSQALCNLLTPNYGCLTGIALDIPAVWQDGTPIGNGAGGIQYGLTYTFTVAVGQALDSTGPPLYTGIGFVTPTFGYTQGYWNPDWGINGYHPTGGFDDFTASYNFDDMLDSGGGVFGPVSVGDSVTPMLYVGLGVYMDNVRVTITDVPEPSTLLLLGLGAFSMFVSARVRRWRS